MSNFCLKLPIFAPLSFHLCLSFFCSNFTYGAVEVIQLPTEDEVVELKSLAKELLGNEINRILEDARKKEEDRKRYLGGVSTVSPEEARRNFSEYVFHYLTETEVKNGLLDVIFTDRYFGRLNELKRDLDPKDPFEIFKKEHLVITHLRSAWRTGPPQFFRGHENTLKEARRRWSLAAQLTDPKEAFEAFKTLNREYPHYGIGGLDFDSDDERIKGIFNYNHFGVPSEESARKAHFLENDLAFFSQQLIRDIYETAVKIMRQSSPGDTLVIFGNTPYFIGRALNHLISSESENSNYRKIIEFPFSGSPGRFRGGNNFTNLNDILTGERLAHLRERMQSVGLSSENQQLSSHATYFIDVVASGGGIAFTAEQLLRDFQSKGMELPNLNVITISKFNVHDQDDRRHSTIAQENPDQSGHITLYFPDLSEPHFSIDCYEIYLPGHVALDFIGSTDHRAFPEYNAFYWQKQYDFLLTRKNPNFEIVKEYFDVNIKHLLETSEEGRL